MGFRRLPITCLSCGADLPARAKFCPQCGTQYQVCSSCWQPSPAEALSCTICGTALPLAGNSGPIFAPLPRAERRQLTVMFCDLVGSTQFAVGRDPEDLLEAIALFQATVAE